MCILWSLGLWMPALGITSHDPIQLDPDCVFVFYPISSSSAVLSVGHWILMCDPVCVSLATVPSWGPGTRRRTRWWRRWSGSVAMVTAGKTATWAPWGAPGPSCPPPGPGLGLARVGPALDRAEETVVGGWHINRHTRMHTPTETHMDTCTHGLRHTHKKTHLPSVLT